MNIQSSIKLITLSSILALSACGSSGGSDAPVNNDLGGIWMGSALETDETTAQDSFGLISESGKAFFLTEGDLVIGSVSTADNNFSGPFTEYYSDGGVGSGTISGTFISRNSFSGAAFSDGSQTSVFSYSYNPAHSRNSSLTDISGTFSETEGAYTETYTIGMDGTITGSDTDGCIFGGAITLPDTDYNMYNVRLTASNCGDANGTYNGLAALIDNTEDNVTLAIAAEGSVYMFAGLIPRT